MSSELWRALERKMAHDLAASVSIGQKAKRIRARLHHEATTMPKGTDAAILTPLQERMRDAFDETHGPLVALFEALGRPVDTENTEGDPVATAAVQLIGPLIGRILALELRVAALEGALE